MSAIVICTFVLNTQILLTHHKSLLEKIILCVHKKNLTLELFFRLSPANATLQAPHNKHQTFTGSVKRGHMMSSMPSYTLWAVCRNKSGPCEAPVILHTRRKKSQRPNYRDVRPPDGRRLWGRTSTLDPTWWPGLWQRWEPRQTQSSQNWQHWDRSNNVPEGWVGNRHAGTARF